MTVSYVCSRLQAQPSSVGWSRSRSWSDPVPSLNGKAGFRGEVGSARACMESLILRRGVPLPLGLEQGFGSIADGEARD